MTAERLRRPVAALTSAVAVAALFGQFLLSLAAFRAQGAGLAETSWRFVGYFTVLTNLAVAIIAGLMAARPDNRLTGHRVRMATATSIVMVGIIYSAVLRALWQPTGWQWWVDHALHDVTPPLFLILWLLSERSGLPWRSALWGLVAPLAYCVYALARGAFDGWYAYPFLNPAEQSPAALATSIAVLSLAFLVLALALVGLDRLLARRAPSLRRTIARG